MIKFETFYLEIDEKLKYDMMNEDKTHSLNIGNMKQEHYQSRLGSELTIPSIKNRENSISKGSHEMKLTFLNEITPSTALPKGYVKRLDSGSVKMEQIFKSKHKLLLIF